MTAAVNRASWPRNCAEPTSTVTISVRSSTTIISTVTFARPDISSSWNVCVPGKACGIMKYAGRASDPAAGARLAEAAIDDGRAVQLIEALRRFGSSE